MELKEGMKIRFSVPVAGSIARPNITPVGAIGEVGYHTHEAYPNLVVWFDDGEWADLTEFDPSDYEIVP